MIHCLATLALFANFFLSHVTARNPLVGPRSCPYQMVQAQTGNCILHLLGDGNFVVRRRIPALDDDPDLWPTSWSIGTQSHHGDYALNTTLAGNLIVYDQVDSAPLWSTNIVGNATAEDHDLIIDGACRLKLQEDGVDLWENIKIPPFQAGQVLQGGDMFRMSNSIGYGSSIISHPFVLPYVMILQHDCNLVRYVGTDNADRMACIWKSQTQITNATTDCYLHLDKARASLYEGSFDNSLGFNVSRPGKYWSTPDWWFDTELYDDEVQ